MRNGFLLFRGLLKRYPARLLLTVLCVFFSFAAYFGLSAARASLEKARADYLARCGRADVLLSCEAADPAALERALAETGGIEAFSWACRLETRGICADGVTRTFRLLALGPDSLLQPVLTGEVGADGGFYLSGGYLADFGGAQLGGVTLENGMALPLRGAYYLPGHNAVYVDPFTVSANGDIVDVLTDTATLWRMGGGAWADLAYVNVRPDVSVDTVIQSLRADSALSVEYAIPFAEDPAFAASEQLFRLVQRICELFPVILFGTGLLFIGVFLAGMASRSRLTAAVLLSDGESLFVLFAGFFLPALLLMLSGMLAALPASALLARAVARTAADNMGVPYAGLSFPLTLPGRGAGLCVLVSLLTGAACTLTVRRGTILDLKRRREKKRASALLDVLAAGLCSCAALSLVLTTCMYRDSVAAVRQELFFDRYGYDAQILYSDFVSLTELEKLSGFPGVQAEPILLGSAELSLGERSCRVLGIGVSETQDMLRFRDGDGAPATPPPNRVLLAEETARRLGAAPGDIVRAGVTYGGRSIDILCRVGGLTRQYSAFTQLISVETVTEYLDSSGVMNGALVTLDGAEEEELPAFLAYAKTLDGVYAVQLRAGALARFDRRFEGVRSLTGLIILDGVLLGFFVFALTGYASWRKNLRKNSILLMLGQSPVRLALGDLKKGLAGAVLGLLAGVPLSVAAERRILALLSTESTVYPLIVRRETLAFGALLICLYMAVSTAGYVLLTRRRAKDIL